jgi:hypothetical protein
MEDREPIPSTTPPPAARTAQALRELHDRARTALAAQRERMGQLEAQLTHQLDTIADTLAQQLASHGGSPGQAQQSLDGVEQLRAELEKTRLEWDREREVWQAERAQLVQFPLRLLNPRVEFRDFRPPLFEGVLAGEQLGLLRRALGGVGVDQFLALALLPVLMV